MITATAGTISRRAISLRIAEARASLKSCQACEVSCKADRSADAASPCGLGTETYCFKKYVSYGEEAELVPTLQLLLSGCNFRCRFCNVAPQCFDPRGGSLVVPSEIARDCEEALECGVKWINILGGEPSLHVHTILEIAAAARRPLPLILKTNGYFSAQTSGLLENVIKLFLVDFKFGNDECARRLAGVDSYMAVLTRNLGALAGRCRLHIRHLLMPGHWDCCFAPVVDWLSTNLPGTRFHLMTGYVPCWRARDDAALGRLATLREVRRAIGHLATRNLDWSSEGHEG